MPVKHKGRKPRNPRTKPFFPHASGYWAAKLLGRTVYLTRWDTPLDQVQVEYEKRKKEAEAEAAESREAGIRAVAAELTIKDIANLYLTARGKDVERGELAPVTWSGYKRSLSWAVEQIGSRAVASLGPLDFASLNDKLTSQYGTKQHEHIVGTVRMALGWAADNDYIDREPKYGTQFHGPGKRRHRHERRTKPLKLFTAPQIRALVEQADPRMKAIVLLGINCAYIQSDIADLPIQFSGNPKDPNRVHLGDNPHIRFDRPKTGVRRKCALWPETVDALRAVMGNRRSGLIFLTNRRQPLVHVCKRYDEQGNLKKVTNCDSLVKPFRELCTDAGCYTSGIGFSSLRSTFETQAWQLPGLSVAHQAAIHWTMGHIVGGPDTASMADTYLQDVPVDVLRLASDPIRQWYLHAK